MLLDLLNKARGSRAGLTGIVAVAAVLLGAGTVAHDSAEGQAIGVGGVAVCALGLPVAAKALLDWWRSRSGGPPPVGPAS